MAASELNFAEEIACHAVYTVELGFVAAVRTRIRILHKPMRLTITTQRLLTILAFNRILQNIITNAAD